jgi:excisionase family DNA binding protein
MDGLSEELYTAEQVAEHLHVTLRTVHEWLRTKRLRGLKAGRQWRITKRDLDAFLAQPVKEAL